MSPVDVPARRRAPMAPRERPSPASDMATAAGACYRGAMNWMATGSGLLAAAVMLGAFGAHGLRGRLDPYAMGIYERAVFYHFIHAIGILVVPLLGRTGALSVTATTWVCALLLGGVVIFSGSLYALAMTGVRALGAITPIGGLSFIAAWLLLAWSLK